MITVVNPDSFEEKIAYFTPDNTVTVTDFDATVSSLWQNSWSVFKEVLGKDYRELADRLFRLFHKFESHPSLTLERRKSLMERWWKNHLKLFRKAGLTESHLSDRLIEPLTIRKGMEWLFRSELPAVVFSAGIQNVIAGILARDIWPDHSATIISNTLIFGPDGKSLWISTSPIHTLNKTETDIWWFWNAFRERAHFIIFGDTLSDKDMVTMDEKRRIVSVGFLNSPKKDDRVRFEKTFDIVVESDHCDGGVVDMLFRRIRQNKKAV